MKNSGALLEEFVGAFGKFYELAEYVEVQPLVAELAVGPPDEAGHTRWQPAKIATDRCCLDPLYARLPAPFPPLYEKLVLSYRWAEVDLGTFALLANPPGLDLTRLFGEVSKDPGLWQALIPAGYIQFAKGPDIDYDPVCFDTGHQRKNRDCPIVKIDHEEILCNNRIKVVGELAPSFEELVRDTIVRAKKAERNY